MSKPSETNGTPAPDETSTKPELPVTARNWRGSETGMDSSLRQLGTLFKAFDRLEYGEKVHVQHVFQHQTPSAIAAIIFVKGPSPQLLAFLDVLGEMYPESRAVIAQIVGGK